MTREETLLHAHALAIALLGRAMQIMDRDLARCRRAEKRVAYAPDAVRRAKAIVKLAIARDRLLLAVGDVERIARLTAQAQDLRVHG